MYNNFSSKKTKKVISALLATALVATSAPITADAATAKVVGVGKTVTYKAGATVKKVTVKNKKVVKATISKKNKKNVTLKGLKAGKTTVTVKTSKKTVKLTVKVGATSITKKTVTTSMTAGQKKTLSVNAVNGKGDTIQFTSNKKSVVKVNKASAKANSKKVASTTVTALKAGTAKITAKSKYTGKSKTFTIKVAAAPVETTPAVSTNPAVVATTPAATATVTNTPGNPGGSTTKAPETTSGAATNAPSVDPDATKNPDATNAPGESNAPSASDDANTTPAPGATDVPTTPDVVTGGTITVTGTAIDGATIVVTNASGAAVNINDRLPAGTYTVTVSKEGYDTKTVEVTLADKEDKVVTVELEESLAVASVEALNLKEVKVTFNQALTTTEATAAEKTANYKIYKSGSTASTTVDCATVSADKKSVTLLLTDTLENGKTNNTITILKAVGLTSDYTSANFTSSDVAIPQVSSIQSVGNKIFKITFSEAVDLATTDIDTNAKAATYFKIIKNGDTTASANLVNSDYSAATVSNDKRTVTITLNTALAAGNYDVSILGASTTPTYAVEDFAGYAVQALTKTVAVSESTKVAVPTKVTAVNRTKVSVKFDGPVTTNGAKLTWKVGSTTKDANSVTLVGNDTLEFTFAAGDAMPAGKVSLTLAGVVDAFGYTVPSYTFDDVEVVADAIAKASVTVKDDDNIVVEFTKAMQGTSGSSNSTTAGDVTNKANYVLTDNATGKIVDLSAVTATYTVATSNGTTTYKVTLTKANWNLKGDYTLVVKDIKDSLGTEMETLTTTINVKDTTQPNVAHTGSYSSTSNKIAIYFSEAMATSGANSITNASNYQYATSVSTDGSGNVTSAPTWNSLPDGTTLTASADGKSVVITLPAGTTLTTQNSAISQTSNSVAVRIGKLNGTGLITVADTSGNVLADSVGNYQADVIILTESNPSIASQAVKADDSTHLLVALTGANLSTVSASDFEYTLDGANYKTAAAAELTTVNGVQYVKLTLNDALSAKVKAANVKVRTKAMAANAGYASKTALGTSFATVQNVATASEYSAAIIPTTATWPFQTSMTSAELLDAKNILITFDGLVDDANLEASAAKTESKLENFLSIYVGSKTTAENAGATDVTLTMVDNNKVLATLATGIDTTQTVTIKTVAQSTFGAVTDYVKDANGIAYAENLTGIKATNSTSLRAMSIVPGLTSGKIATTASDKIVIKFNKAVDGASIYTGLAAGGNVTLVPYSIDTNGKFTLTTAGNNFGSISGFTNMDSTAVTGTCTLKLDAAGTELTIDTFDVAQAKIFANGTLSYTPGAGVYSATSSTNKITTATVTSKVEDAAPEIVSVTSSTDKKTVTIKFSENLDASTVNKTNVTTTVNLDWQAGDTISVSGNTITITFANAPASTENIAITSAVKDLTGKNVAAEGDTITAVSGSFTGVTPA